MNTDEHRYCNEKPISVMFWREIRLNTEISFICVYLCSSVVISYLFPALHQFLLSHTAPFVYMTVRGWIYYKCALEELYPVVVLVECRHGC